MPAGPPGQLSKPPRSRAAAQAPGPPAARTRRPPGPRLAPPPRPPGTTRPGPGRKCPGHPRRPRPPPFPRENQRAGKFTVKSQRHQGATRSFPPPGDPRTLPRTPTRPQGRLRRQPKIQTARNKGRAPRPHPENWATLTAPAQRRRADARGAETRHRGHCLFTGEKASTTPDSARQRPATVTPGPQQPPDRPSRRCQPRKRSKKPGPTWGRVAGGSPFHVC
jgi:hypothetical protein